MVRESVRHIIREIYSEVLFELAEESGKLDQVTHDLSCVVEVLRREAEFAEIINSELIKPDDKAQMVRRVFRGKIDDLTLDFLSVLARKNRMGFLAQISEKYQMLVDTHQGRSLVEVTLANTPSDDQVAKMTDDLSNAINAKVKLAVDVDPEIVGGIIIRKDDIVIDNSIKRMLNQASEGIRTLGLKTLGK